MNKATRARQARADIEWAERTGTKLAVTRLAEALDIFADLMDYYRPTFTVDKKGKRRIRNGHRDEFNEAAQMVVKIGTELAPAQESRGWPAQSDTLPLAEAAQSRGPGQVPPRRPPLSTT